VRSFDMSALNDHDQLVGAAQWSFDGGMTWNARATMLIVPEPTAAATTLLAIACGVGLARRRRRSRTHFSGLISNPVASLG
jgi:ABC-type spermidine/putrescine transport system permease subunit II